MGSLESDRPDLLSEWNFEKNSDLDPGKLGSSSHKKVWWTCNLGHDYFAIVGNRALNGSKCPICTNRTILAGFNDFASAYPELLREWSFELNGELRPDAIARSYSKKVWWTCALGHDFSATPANRSSNGSGCPFCAGKQVLAGFNDLSSKRPDIAAEWNDEKNIPLTPSDVTWSSGRNVWWKCAAGHEFETRVNDRTAAGRVGSCPVCKNQRVIEGVNDLATTHPALAAEWNWERNEDILPSQISAGSSLNVWWRCTTNSRHEWRTKPAYRSSQTGTGCPVCSNKIVMPGLNDFETSWPELAREWNLELNSPIRPSDVSPGSSAKQYWWSCEKRHDFKMTVNARTNLGAGCPFCANQLVLAGFNDLLTIRPDLAAEWHPDLNSPLQPNALMAGSNRRVWWQCAKFADHAWQISPSARSGASATGCPICANKRVLWGFNDLQTLFPDIAAEWHAELNGELTPDNIVSGSWTRVWWQCPNDSTHAYLTRVVNRTSNKQNGCPTCAQTGFDSSSPGVFYVLENSSLAAKKVGITNGNREHSRLKLFQQAGWDIVFIQQSTDGRQILELETRMLRWIRKDLKLPAYLTIAEMRRTGGFSETFEGDAISNLELVNRAKELISELKIGVADH